MVKPDFEAIRETDDDPEFFCQAMGIKRIPYPEILRQRMDGIGRSMRSTLLWENTNLLVKNHISPSKSTVAVSPLMLMYLPVIIQNPKKKVFPVPIRGATGMLR